MAFSASFAGKDGLVKLIGADVIDWFQTTYYVSVFVVSACAGVSRVVHNGHYKNVLHCLAVASTSGFFSFGAVALLSHFGYLGDDKPLVVGLGASALIGLSGKEQFLYLSAFNKAIAKKLGVERQDNA